MENSRAIVAQLDREFAAVTNGLRALLATIPVQQLYAAPVSQGENVLRCAAAIEQLFGGLTANLWDDPFEWTLPETLSTPELIVEYLAEVDATRARAFASIRSDSDLLKLVAAPSGESLTLLAMVLDALLRATRYHDRAACGSVGNSKML